MSKITLKKPKSNDMCPVGFHVVRGHRRTCHSGTRTWVDAHNAKNPKAGKTAYLKENIHYLYWNADLDDYEDLKAIKGFPAHHEIDAAILFWLDHWESQGLKFPDDLDPLVIKAMMAIESSFNPNTTSRRSTAAGLMQVTGTARRNLGGSKDKHGYRFIRNELVTVEQIDLKDPLVNVAAATRWLSAKFSAIPSGNVKNTFNMLKAYNDWSDDGAAYAEKVLQLYKKSR